jgi:hypothetical protein
MKKFLLIILSALVLGAVARADMITIFNTGVDNSNALLPAGSVDPHYLLGGGSAFAGANPPPVWIANGPNSQWITPTANASDAFFGGVTYHYTTTFTLPVDFTSATISGLWATDNGSSMSLNGGPSVSMTPDVGFLVFTPFTITSGFVAGTNTLMFDVLNSGAFNSQTGLRVEISGFFTPANGVPDSGSSAVLFGGGLMALGMFASRLRMKRSVTTTADERLQN